MILIPPQIVKSGRPLIYRMLAWTSSLETLFTVHDCVSQRLLN